MNKGRFKKGQTPWNKGKKGLMPIPWIKGKTKKDYPQISGGGVKKGNIPWNKNKKGSQKAWNKGFVGFMGGIKNGRWKGGISSLQRQIRNFLKTRQWRSDIFTRDEFTCQVCGQKGSQLEAHHIKSFSKILEDNKIRNIEEAIRCEELWNLNNGKTLCLKCHDKIKHHWDL